MSKVAWAKVRRRWYLAVPFVNALVVYYGVTSDEAIGLWLGLISVVLFGATGGFAASNVDLDREREKDTLSGPAERGWTEPGE